MEQTTLTFRVHTAKLLNEIVDCALAPNQGVLKIPINQFRLLLCQVAGRAAELNDPILNKIMCDLTLYDEVDPTSANYNKNALKIVETKYHQYIKEIQKG